MQEYEDICRYMQTKICTNMQIYACQKYAKICNLYASYEDICNRKYMQKYVIENMQKYENICKNMQKNICKNMHINYMQIYVIYM